DVGPDDAADEVDLVLLQHLVGDLLAHVGLLLVVAVDHLDVEPADSAAEVVEGQLDGVLHVLADDAGGAGERGDEPDPHRLRRRRRDGREGREEPDENHSSHRAHGILPQVTLAVVPFPARSGNEFRRAPHSTARDTDTALTSSAGRPPARDEYTSRSRESLHHVIGNWRRAERLTRRLGPRDPRPYLEARRAEPRAD